MSLGPGISVVIPTFNNADTLADSVKSVLGQRWEELELIVVDDGSTDGTAALIEKLGSQHPQLRKLSQPNAGAAAARNTGVRAATHNYIAFLDADDQWSGSKLGEQMAVFDRDPSTTVCFTAYTVEHKDGTDHVVLSTWDPSRHAVLETLLQGCCVTTSTVIAKRAALLQVGLFDTSLRCCEDHDLWFRLALAGERFAYTPVALTHMRARPRSLSADESEVARCSELVYERLFASGELPDDVQARRRFYLARCYLNSACRHLDHGDGPASLSSLSRAARTRVASIRPGWLALAARASTIALGRSGRRGNRRPGRA